VVTVGVPWAATVGVPRVAGVTDPPRMVVMGKKEEVGMNEEAVEVVAVEVVEATEQLQVHLWAWGLVPTKFWQPSKPYSNQGGQIMPTIY
jgi:hypothetical protein